MSSPEQFLRKAATDATLNSKFREKIQVVSDATTSSIHAVARIIMVAITGFKSPAGLMARPSKYTEKLADKMCERIATGESVRSIVEDEKMPAMTTFFRWLRENDKFRQQYEKAKELQADLFADEIMEIADDDSKDEERPQAVQRSKLQVDARKWVASRLLPKRYGDKHDITSDGKALKGNTVVFTDFDEAGGQ